MASLSWRMQARVAKRLARRAEREFRRFAAYTVTRKYGLKNPGQRQEDDKRTAKAVENIVIAIKTGRRCSEPAGRDVIGSTQADFFRVALLVPTDRIMNSRWTTLQRWLILRKAWFCVGQMARNASWAQLKADQKLMGVIEDSAPMQWLTQTPLVANGVLTALISVLLTAWGWINIHVYYYATRSVIEQIGLTEYTMAGLAVAGQSIQAWMIYVVFRFLLHKRYHTEDVDRRQEVRRQCQHVFDGAAAMVAYAVWAAGISREWCHTGEPYWLLALMVYPITIGLGVSVAFARRQAERFFRHAAIIGIPMTLAALGTAVAWTDGHTSSIYDRAVHTPFGVHTDERVFDETTHRRLRGTRTSIVLVSIEDNTTVVIRRDSLPVLTEGTRAR